MKRDDAYTRDKQTSVADQIARGTAFKLRRDLLSSAGSAIIGFIQAGAGAVERTAQSKMRDIIDVRDFGAVGDGVTNDTAAITAAIAAGDFIRIPSGDWSVSQIDVPADKFILTDDRSTHFVQRSGQPSDTPIIRVRGSNVFIGTASYTGDIANQTGEWSHAIDIFIEESDTASRSNICIGDINASDIRGDGVCMGVAPVAYAAGYRLSGISVGRVTGDNIYRNGASVTGGSDIDITSVNCTRVGVYAFAAEPDVGSGPITGLKVGYIKGRTVGFVGLGTDYLEAWAGHIDVDPDYTTASNPAYPAPAGDVYKYGLHFRDCKSLRVERFYADGHDNQAITRTAGGTLTRQSLSFGHVEIPSSCLVENVILAYIVTGDNTYLTIDNLLATTTRASHSIFNECYNVSVGVANVALLEASFYMRACTDATTHVLNISAATGNGGSVFLSSTRCKAFGGTQACDVFFNFSTRCVAIGVDATAVTSYDNSGTENLFLGSNQGGAFVLLQDSSGNVWAEDGGFLVTPGFILSSGDGIGYTTGAGGTVTQITSRATGVTIDECSGLITLFSAAGSAAWTSFTVTNNKVAANDTIRVVQKSGADKYQIFVTNVAAGSFEITFATTGGTTTEQPVFNFGVFKGANS